MCANIAYCIVRSQYIQTRLHDITSQKAVIFCHHRENPTHIATCNLEKMLGLCTLSAKRVGGRAGTNYRGPEGGLGPDCVAYVFFFFVFVSSIIICQLYKLTL